MHINILFFQGYILFQTDLFLFPLRYISHWHKPEHLVQTAGSWQCCRLRAISKASSYLDSDVGSLQFSNLEQKFMQAKLTDFLLRCDRTKMAAYVPPRGRIRSSRSSTNFLVALILSQTALLGFQSSRLSHTLSFALLLRRPPFQVFNLPFVFSHTLSFTLLLCRLPFRVFNLPFYIFSCCLFFSFSFFFLFF